MFLPIAIHKEEGSVFGVTVPDVAGCFSHGESIAEAIHNAKEAITSHIETLLELGEEPEITQSSIEDLQEHQDYAGATWALVDIDLTRLSRKPECFNVSWPEFVLYKVDKYIEERHESRSGFLARAALEVIEKETHHTA